MRSATTQALNSLVITGPLRAVEAHPDGSWTVTPVSGPPLLLLNPDEAHAYLERVEGTGPQALAPAAPRVAGGCECIPATTEPTDPRQVVDLIEARAITQQLGVLGIPSRARAAAWDATIGAAVARVDAAHGLYAVVVPAQGRRYVVLCNARRIGTLSAVRGPGATDSYVATQYAAILRDRGDYDPS